MNAAELFDALRGLPAARALAVTGNRITESRLVAGVEVARVELANDQALRKAWRDRSGGGPTPLLVLTDEPEALQTLRALGPTSSDGPVRVIRSEDLLRVLERLPQLPKLQAVRELAEELDRLDQTGISGLQVSHRPTDRRERTSQLLVGSCAPALPYQLLRGPQSEQRLLRRASISSMSSAAVTKPPTAIARAARTRGNALSRAPTSSGSTASTASRLEARDPGGVFHSLAFIHSRSVGN